MNKTLKIFSLLSIISTILFAIPVLADNTGGSGNIFTPGSNSGGQNNNCYYHRSCLHWIKVNNSQLKDAVSHTYWGMEITSSEENAYKICSNTEKNPTGYTVIAGHYNYSTGQLEFGNITDSSGYNQSHKTNRSKYDSFMFETAISDMTWEDVMHSVMNQYGFSEQNLSIFCPGMVERKYDEPHSGTYSSTSASAVKNGNTTDTQGVDSTSSTKSATSSIYLKSKNNSNISTTFSLNHTLISHVDHSSKPTYEITRDGSSIKKEEVDLSSNGSSTVYEYSESFDIPLGTQKKICQTISHTESVSIVDHFVERAGISTLTGTDYDYSGWLNPSTSVCAEAKHPYNFKITPTQSTTNNNAISAGESLPVSGTAKVSKNDNSLSETITSPDTELRLIQFTLSPSTPDSANVSGGTSTSDPCNFFRGKLSGYFGDCANVDSFSGSLDPGATRTLSGDAIVPDAPIGTKYCTALGVFRADSGDGYSLSNNWNITGANCYTIAKKPNFQVWNGGTFTTGNITTSTSKKVIGAGFGDFKSAQKRIFGSWDEQIVIAGGTISDFGFASGTALGYSGYSLQKPGGHTDTDKFLDLSPLTISNTDSAKVGHSNIVNNSSALLARLHARFDSAANSSHLNIIRSDNVYEITNNITSPDGPYYSVKDLPETIIIAKNGIKIAPGVTNVDAWLIVEDGYIDTCSGFEKNKTSSTSNNTGVCDNLLKINGPVFAKELRLNRTGGAGNGNNSIDPAEIFNLRPDVYLWAFAQAQDFSEAYVTYSRELAPRL